MSCLKLSLTRQCTAQTRYGSFLTRLKRTNIYPDPCYRTFSTARTSVTSRTTSFCRHEPTSIYKIVASYRRLHTRPEKTLHIAHIAFGSNLGDRKAYIEQALDLLDTRGINVVNTSMLYESDPMYVTDQPQFLNGVCTVLTTLAPHDLMRACQQIETQMGRVKLVNKGARCIDLDILLFDNERIQTEDLTIPHIGIEERDFVYVPLSE